MHLLFEFPFELGFKLEMSDSLKENIKQDIKNMEAVEVDIIFNAVGHKYTDEVLRKN